MNPSSPLISCPCRARAGPWLVLAAARFPLQAGGQTVPSPSATVQLRQAAAVNRRPAPAAEMREGRPLLPAGRIRMPAPVNQIRSGVQDTVATQRTCLPGMRQTLPARLAASQQHCATLAMERRLHGPWQVDDPVDAQGQSLRQLLLHADAPQAA